MTQFASPAALLATAISFLAGDLTSARAQNERSPSGRYYAPAASPLDQLRSTVEAQQNKLRAYANTNQRYQNWFAEKKQEIDRSQKAAERREAEWKREVRSWNTRANPTCDSGLTYAECTCRSGNRGKAQKRWEVGELEWKARRAWAIRNAQVRTNNETILRYQEFSRQYRDESHLYQENRAKLRDRQSAGDGAGGGITYNEDAPRRP